MTEHELTTLANEVLRDVLAPHGFEHADMIAGADHDGEPSLVVIAHFKADAGVTGGAASTRALSRLRQALLDRGENRFPYIRYDYPGDEVLGDEVLGDEVLGDEVLGDDVLGHEITDDVAHDPAPGTG